eukprot:TCONS_00022124-protein
MSSPKSEPTLAGHAPAVKVGGMRVAQHQHSHSDKQSKAEREQQEEEFQTEKNDEAPMVVSGAVSKGDKDFTPAAAKVAHQKPMPTKEKPPQKGQANMSLKQPGKH